MSEHSPRRRDEGSYSSLRNDRGDRHRAREYDHKSGSRRDDNVDRNQRDGSRRNYNFSQRDGNFDNRSNFSRRNDNVDRNNYNRSERDEPFEKEKPNYGLSGKLAKEANTTNKGVVLKYSEPPEARPSIDRWRMYIFKGDKEVGLQHLHRQTAWRIGRDRSVSDIPADHPSISKQHAVLQFRQVQSDSNSNIKLYVIDLESANGTFLNGERIESSRYYEIQAEDGLKFGTSSREYVFLKEKTK